MPWREVDARTAALGSALLAQGLHAGDHVAVYARNSAEFIEGYLGVFQAAMVPINVNYRYGRDELTYLLTDSEATAVILQQEFAEHIPELAQRVPTVRHWFVIADPSMPDGVDTSDTVHDYEAEILAHLGERPPAEVRSGDDRLIVYTGGTTGMPKGVEWRQRDVFEALFGSTARAFNLPKLIDVPDLVARRMQPGPRGMSASPLMHGTGLFQQIVMLYSGGTSVILPGRKFDPDLLWRTTAEKRVTALVIVGEAFARPMVDLLESDPGPVRPERAGGVVVVRRGLE